MDDVEVEEEHSFLWESAFKYAKRAQTLRINPIKGVALKSRRLQGGNIVDQPEHARHTKRKYGKDYIAGEEPALQGVNTATHAMGTSRRLRNACPYRLAPDGSMPEKVTLVASTSFS